MLLYTSPHQYLARCKTGLYPFPRKDVRIKQSLYWFAMTDSQDSDNKAIHQKAMPPVYVTQGGILEFLSPPKKQIRPLAEAKFGKWYKAVYSELTYQLYLFASHSFSGYRPSAFSRAMAWATESLSSR